MYSRYKLDAIFASDLCGHLQWLAFGLPLYQPLILYHMYMCRRVFLMYYLSTVNNYLWLHPSMNVSCENMI